MKSLEATTTEQRFLSFTHVLALLQPTVEFELVKVTARVTLGWNTQFRVSMRVKVQLVCFGSQGSNKDKLMKQMYIDSRWMERGVFQLMWFQSVKVQKVNRVQGIYAGIQRIYPLTFQSVLCLSFAQWVDCKRLMNSEWSHCSKEHCTTGSWPAG